MFAGSLVVNASFPSEGDRWRPVTQPSICLLSYDCFDLQALGAAFKSRLGSLAVFSRTSSSVRLSPVQRETSDATSLSVLTIIMVAVPI